MWIIIRRYLDKPFYTAHLDPECKWLIKKDDPQPKVVRLRRYLGVHTPCKSCGGVPSRENHYPSVRREYVLKREKMNE
jgi:hypothetical protein